MSYSATRIAALRYLASRTAPLILNHVTDERVILLTHILERIARCERHKEQLRVLRGFIRDNHPAAELARRVLSLHPNVRRQIINSLGINATWLGDQERRAFAAEHGTYPPFLIVISPTMRCNLRCLGCYAGHYPREKDPLSFETLDRVVEEGKEMGVYFYTISGGEPFMRRDLLDLYEKHSDCVFHVYTNGTCFDDATIARLQKCGNVAPAFSVEGWREQTDFRRGKGVYDRVMATMDACRQAGLFFGFSATATRLNAEVYYSEAFYDHLIEKGCLFGWFFIFVPVGQDSTTDLMVTPQQRDQLRRTVTRMRATKPIFVADFWNDGCLTGGCMSAGSLYLHINYRGDIEPCVFMHFAEENIVEIHQRGGHLSDILETPLFRRIREVNRKDPNPLRPCPIIDHNEWLEEALKGTKARPTHPGAEDIVGRLAPQVRAWAEEYGKLADYAWYKSGEYEWAQRNDVLWGPG
ncbi:MAG: radical SAM/SPASM domain-containing protein [Armatimonadota bacterium]